MSARNAGLARARNDIVLLTDDDCLTSPEWAERLTRRLREGEVSIATVRMRRDGPVTSILDYQRIFNPRPVDGMTVDYPLASCMGIRQDLVGFWFDDDLDSGDELQFGARLRDAGITTAYDTEAPPPLHLVLERLESVTERFYRYGVSNARVLIRKDRPEFSIPTATALYSSLCGNRVTTPRRFEEVADPQLRQAFATLELALLGSFLAGYLDEAGRGLGREIIRLDRRSWDAGWHEIERRLEDDFAWDGDWGRLPVDFARWLAPREPRAPALSPEVAAILRQGAPLTLEAVSELEIDRAASVIAVPTSFGSASTRSGGRCGGAGCPFGRRRSSGDCARQGSHSATVSRRWRRSPWGPSKSRRLPRRDARAERASRRRSRG
jgi:hypothetical protein